MDEAAGSRGRSELSVALIGAVAAIGAFCIALFSVIQVALAYFYCDQEVARDLNHGRSTFAQLELDTTPVVRCHTETGTLEFPIAGAVASAGTAVVLLIAVGVLYAFHRRRS